MILKRLFDIVFSLIGLVLLAPLFLFLVILIKIRMPGDIFYRQTRAGRHGIPFTMVKFRTMEMHSSGTTVTVRAIFTPLAIILLPLPVVQ